MSIQETAVLEQLSNSQSVQSFNEIVNDLLASGS
jgi:hypothetical protein